MPTASGSPTIAQEFDIGGRSLHIECRGGGSPTILFLHGFAGDRTHGYHLFDGYADRHRVCVYDRANMGLSDPVGGVQTGAAVIADLKRLLEGAEVSGPYLLVANSFGGVLAEILAGDQAGAVAGMVLVDASLHSDADVDRYFADRGDFDLEEMKAEFASGPELIAWTIHDEARAALQNIPDIPITYLRALQGSGPPAEAEAQEIWEAGLDALLARSSNARVVDVDGPHSLPPPPVHGAVNQMLDLLRHGLAPASPIDHAWIASDSLTPHPLGETDAPLGYYEYLPPSYGDGDQSPLLVFLHGLLESGDGTAAELMRLLADGGSIPYLIDNDDWPADRPFVVLAPQHPGPVNDELYAGCFEGPMPGDCALPLQTENGHPEDNSICHRPAGVHEFIAYAVDAYDVDPERVYLTGLSCGGYAAYEYAAEHGASQIAAMVPIAGEGRLAWDQVGCALGDVPIWAFHGDADDEISPAGSIEPLTNLADCPSAEDHTLTIYPGVGHNSWTETYDLSAGNDVYTWLLTFTRP